MQGEPARRACDRLVAGQQRVDGLEGLRHHLPLLQVVQTHHGGVRGKGAWAHTEDVTAHRHVVEKHGPRRHDKRMMKRQRRDAGPEADPLGALGSRSNEEIASGDDLVPGRVVLTDPRLGIAELLGPNDQLEVTPQGPRGILLRVMQGGEKQAELQWPLQRLPLPAVDAPPPPRIRANVSRRTRRNCPDLHRPERDKVAREACARAHRQCANVGDVTTVLFVCTGNLCRSPSAELFLARLLSEEGPTDVTVESAGTMETDPPVPRELLREASGFGLDLSSHVPRIVDVATTTRADIVIGMAREHVRETVLANPPSFTKTFTLREIVRRGGEKGQRRPQQSLEEWLDQIGEGRRHADLIGYSPEDDIYDPMGGTSTEYRTMLLELASLTRTLHSLIWSKSLERTSS